MIVEYFARFYCKNDKNNNSSTLLVGNFIESRELGRPLEGNAIASVNME